MLRCGRAVAAIIADHAGRRHSSIEPGAEKQTRRNLPQATLSTAHSFDCLRSLLRRKRARPRPTGHQPDSQPVRHSRPTARRSVKRMARRNTITQCLPTEFFDFEKRYDPETLLAPRQPWGRAVTGGRPPRISGWPSARTPLLESIGRARSFPRPIPSHGLRSPPGPSQQTVPPETSIERTTDSHSCP